LIAEWSGVGRVGADADELDRPVLAGASLALRVCAGQRLRLAAGLDADDALVDGEPRQVLDVAAVESDAPHAADEEASVSRPQVPRQPGGVIHRSDEEKCPCDTDRQTCTALSDRIK